MSRNKQTGRPITVAIIDGSPRRESSSRALALNLQAVLIQLGVVVRFFNQHENKLPLFDDEMTSEKHPAVQALFRAVSGVDCIVLSSPEYHNSMSAALKNALDWISRLPDGAIPPMTLCGLIGGGGAMGNSGASVQMMMAVRSLKWWLIPDAILSVPQIWDALDGVELRDSALRERAQKCGAAIKHYASAFRRAQTTLD